VHLVALVRGREGMPLDAYCDVMVKGTWNVAQACATHNVRRLVNISSIVASGWPSSHGAPYRVGEQAEFGKADLFYSLAKSLGEAIGNAYHQAHGLDVIHLRPGVIARDGANADPRPTDAPFWFIHVDPEDVAHAVEAALRTDTSHGTFQIVAGRDDALFDWRGAADKIGYAPSHNWPEIPVAKP
jgi:nucleoside-diphosphate-sugar epimerase